jgi:molybdate transport system substrate-binding protein
MNQCVKLASGLLAMLLCLGTHAAEIKVIGSVGVKAVLEEAKPLFEAATGHEVILVIGTAVPLKRQIEGGEAFDVAILTPQLIADLVRQRRIVPESALDVAKTGLGLAVRRGAAKPDVSTPEALKRALLGAGSIAHSKEGQAGVAAVKVMERLGVGEQMKARTLLETRPGGSLIALHEGKADLGFALTSEIVPMPEVDYVGPVPAELQTYVVFTAGISPASKNDVAAKTFVRFLRGATVASILKAKGME